MQETIELATQDATYKGILVNEEKDFLVLKLENGYNIGILKKKVKEQRKIAEAKAKEHAGKKAPADPKLPTISLLHTGGTIASRVDYSTGAVSARFKPEDMLEMFPELGKMANIRSRLVSNMMSENMRFHHYNLMASAVAEEVKQATRGVIITHGTDTLHYSAAALAFALEDINIPVVLIGSQRSSDRPSTDSASNLVAAATFICGAGQPGVYVCMHSGQGDEECMVIEGVNSRKMHTSRRDAFRPINKGLVATVNVEKRRVNMIAKAQKPAKPFQLRLFDDRLKVGLIKVHPQMFAAELDPYSSFDGLVVEATGLGQAQMISFDDHSKENERIKEKLKEIASKIPLAVAPQSIYGRINMNVYSEGRQLLGLGALGNYCDMTPETAFIKLAWLLSNHPQEVKELYETNLRGEISSRSEDLFLK